jgi:succinate dehydrogenase/fumarate reductase flavoprotein subunit
VTKEILGVIAESGGKQINIKARKAVIMTCGGFEANREMMATYIEEAPVPIYVGGNPYNTGDGIKMVLDIGAELWHMNGIEWARDGLKPPELPAAFWLDFKAWSLIVVNKDGNRFKDESVTYGHAKKPLEVFRFDNSEKQRWANYPCYYIFDEKTRLAGPILMTERSVGRDGHVTYNVARELYYVTDWSKDNSKEIGKGWIKQGNTLAELAEKTGINPAGLEAQVAKYNEYCAAGKDPDLFRPKNYLAPIVTPPYYSAECVVNTINTQGGPRRNAKSQVMSPYAKPIPRLYAGGEFGSIWGYLYPGACNLTECTVSGRISGKNAAAELPWG